MWRCSPSPLAQPTAAGVPPKPFVPPLALAGLPLDLVVVEDDVEVAGTRVAAVDEDQLRAVEAGRRTWRVVADVDPVGAEGGPAAVGGGAVGDGSCRRRAGVDVVKEGDGD